MNNSLSNKLDSLQKHDFSASANVVSVESFSGDINIVFADGVCEKCLGDTHGISVGSEPLVMKCEKCGHELKCD